MKNDSKKRPDLSDADLPAAAGRQDRATSADTYLVGGSDRAKTSATIKATPKGYSVHVVAPLDEMLKNLGLSTGTRHGEVAIRIVEQLANSIQRSSKDNINTDALLIEAIGRIEELGPQNLTEAMLATQITATHEAALMFLRRSTIDGQTFEGSDANVLRATRLMRLHLEQIEAMQKLKGHARQQKVTVEHVHVYQGGQAVVGALNSTRGDGGPGK